MTVLVALTFGLVVWLVAWSMFEVKAFDAFLFTALVTLTAAGLEIAKPFVQKILRGPPATPGER